MDAIIQIQPTMNSPYLPIALGMTPLMVRRIIDNLPATCYDAKPDEKRFSLREAVAHLADWESIHLARIQAAIENPGSSMRDIDEGQKALDGDYAHRSPHAEATRFITERPTLIAYLAGLNPKDWHQTFVHSVKGEMSVLEYAATILGHDVYHLDHLLEYLPVQ